MVIQVPICCSKVLLPLQPQLWFENWAFVGAAIRACFYFFNTSRAKTIPQNRKGNSHAFLITFCNWWHPKRKKLNSPPLILKSHSKLSLLCWKVLSTTFKFRCLNSKSSKKHWNFHLKIACQIGREIPDDF